MTDVVHVTKGGFGRLEALIEGLDSYRGHKVRVLAKNENYIVRYVEEGGVDGEVMACTPDLICVVDSDTGMTLCVCVCVGVGVGVSVGGWVWVWVGVGVCVCVHMYA